MGNDNITLTISEIFTKCSQSEVGHPEEILLL